MTRTPQDEFARLAYEKAIHQAVQDHLRGLMGSGMGSTDILSEDLPPLTARVPGAALTAYLKKLEAEVLAIDEQLGEFTLVRQSSGPGPSTTPSTEDPFDDTAP